jgi:hypothetical protein
LFFVSSFLSPFPPSHSTSPSFPPPHMSKIRTTQPPTKLTNNPFPPNKQPPHQTRRRPRRRLVVQPLRGQRALGRGGRPSVSCLLRWWVASHQRRLFVCLYFWGTESSVVMGWCSVLCILPRWNAGPGR